MAPQPQMKPYTLGKNNCCSQTGRWTHLLISPGFGFGRIFLVNFF